MQYLTLIPLVNGKECDAACAMTGSDDGDGITVCCIPA